MRIFTIYDVATGEIKRRISTSQEGILINVFDGEDYIEGEYSDETYIVVNGVAQQKPKSELDAIAAERATAQMKMRRDMLLNASDFTQVPDAPFTSEQQQAWRVYRQALRDLPDNINDIFNIAWPVEPNS
jgi:hypothetical protein